MTRIRQRFHQTWLLAVCLLLSLNVFAAGSLDAQLDRTRIAEGETTVLTLTASGDAKGTPDLSPLGQNFDVLSQGQSTNMSFINGRSSSTREWRLVLAPKRSGKLSVPSLKLGSASSQPLTLEVLPASQAAKLGKTQPVALETEVEPKQPYVQQQMVYTVRLLTRAPLQQASLSEPQVANAIVQRLGEDKQYPTYRSGQQYQVVERRYVILPQHSGKLEIDGPVLSAQVPDPKQRGNSLRDRFFGNDSFFGNDPFAGMDSFFGQTRPIQMRGKNVSVDVRPQPVNAPSPWLPADSLMLQQSWSPDPPQFRVGEPVTRTITINATGVSAEQLPDLNPAITDGFKTYPDKPQAETTVKGGELVAQKVIKVAMVPTRAGDVSLPGVNLSWWDAKTDKLQTAHLPAQTIKVLPGAGGTTSTPPANTVNQGSAEVQQPTQANNPETLVSPDVGSNTPEAEPSNVDHIAGYWPKIAGLLAIAWLITVVLWLRSRAKTSLPATGGEPRSEVPVTVKPAKLLPEVERACVDNDPKATRSALLAWAAAAWPEHAPKRLEDLAQKLGGETGIALRALDRHLYSGDAGGWDGASVWRLISSALHSASKHRKAGVGANDPLPPLYPQNS